MTIDDLNSVFTDGDGEPLTFSDLATHNNTIIQVSLSGDASEMMNINALSKGSTKVTIQANAEGDTPATDDLVIKVLATGTI